MQLTINTSLQQSQLDYSQFAFKQVADNGMTSSLPSPPQDRVDLSSEARRHRDGEHPHAHRHQHTYEPNANPGAQISDPQNAPAADGNPALTPQNQQTSITAQQDSLSLQAGTLSIDGSINTADGAEASFSLDLQILHVSASSSAFNLSTGPDGYEFGYAGSSAELSSTSFSFSLANEALDGTPASGSGLGDFSVKDELKEIRQIVKPLIKEFLRDACVPSDKPNVNQLLRTIA